MHRLPLILLPMLLCACPSEKPLDTSDIDADTDADADTDTDADADADTDADADQGLVGYLGSATADETGYSGTEEWYFIAEKGEGKDLCRIRYDLNAIASRDDCVEWCTWAYDLEVSNATIMTEAGPGCLSLSALGAVSDLDGTVIAIGYAAEYYGHAEALMMYVDGGWDGVAWASYDEATSTFDYDRQDGFFSY